MAQFTIKTTENKYLEFVIRDDDGDIFSLSGMNATINIQRHGTATLATSNSCEVTNATAGECRYLYDGSLSAGDYKAEIVITNGTYTYITPDIEIEIVATLPS